MGTGSPQLRPGVSRGRVDYKAHFMSPSLIVIIIINKSPLSSYVGRSKRREIETTHLETIHLQYSTMQRNPTNP